MAMASSTIITRVQTYSQPPNLSNPSVPLNVFKFSSSFQTRISHTHHGLKLNHLLNAASEGSASELIEDSKFVPLNPDDPTFGPPALLLLGFQVDELVKIQKFLKELDGEFLEIAKSLPRICFLSGLTGEEMMMFIDSFSESGLAGTVFAAVVPNSADKPLQEVIDEIMGDHEMMKSGASR
ncbi:uncharacterized protein LOC112525486 isoform X2 [Cynara cardunculus var. scolymus]|uniref:uncharacterized protein LOC112525486 isoform X2 n=1 Tax=Cynara cardunculus var. scolymus TaxID=59895 RepID=UPI000D62A6F3|nr:uncharacterized protein LOC112525486 isoform X2 [Cynara cardunculus var. scolymus]